MADLSRLPGPVSDVWEWQMSGACRNADPDLFFHPEGERGPRKSGRDAAAVAVCAGCPVLGLCRTHALKVREPYGVWGGMTEDERENWYAGHRVAPTPVTPTPVTPTPVTPTPVTPAPVVPAAA